jgi:aryl-alcohol dehydrogenase-like predicted oxidoreductase
VEYRRLGTTGLKVSVLSFGSWVTFVEQAEPDVVRACLADARAAGITLFDTAETYAGGRAEWLLGAAIENLGWERSTYILSTKLYWGIGTWPHLRTTLNRKYLLQGVGGCLDRLRTPFVDLLLCHRRDPETPIEEIVWAMSDIVASGKALYWGTSEWPAADIRAAWDLADRHGLRIPACSRASTAAASLRAAAGRFRDTSGYGPRSSTRSATVAWRTSRPWRPSWAARSRSSPSHGARSIRQYRR